MKEGKLKDRCPACGAPKTAFEPYTDPMAERRRKILNLHLHPIAVHFPTTFAVASFVFLLATLFFSEPGRTLLVSTTRILVLFIPLLVIVTFLAGLVDGRIRFRKITNSQILKRKILYAVLLFFVSLALALIIWIFGFNSLVTTLISILLGAIAVFLSYLLGLMGMSITGAAFPGK